jgi:putative endonuclease
MDRRTLGRIGECAAADALARRGYAILERNVRTRWGEIDLVARQDGAIVFVEVKARTSEERGRPLDACHPRKQQRLERLALAFLHTRGLWDRPARFDVVGVTLTPGGEVVDIEVVPDAFGAARG